MLLYLLLGDGMWLILFLRFTHVLVLLVPTLLTRLAVEESVLLINARPLYNLARKLP